MAEATYIWDERDAAGINARLEKLETAIGLPLGFCRALAQADDWSFVIKLHALLEGALAQLVVAKLGRDELMSIFSRLDLSQAGTGKLAFAEKLLLLDPAERGFIRYVSELRNRAVHGVPNASFSLAEYVRQLDKDQVPHFAEITGYAHAERDSVGHERLRDTMIRTAKKHVLTMGLYTLSIIHLDIANVRPLDTEQSIRDDLEEFAEALRPHLRQHPP